MTTYGCRAPQAARGRGTLCALVIIAALTGGGCASKEWVTVREAPKNPLAGTLRLFSSDGPRPTPRTRQFIRQSDLQGVRQLPPREMLARLQQHVAAEPTAAGMHAIGELAYIEGIQAMRRGDEATALDMYGASVAHAYMYLLDDRFTDERNEFDPEYRQACDLYNGALEGVLRIAAAGGGLRPGRVLTVDTGGQKFDIQVDVRGRWKIDEIERFEFASDYEVNGLANQYHTYGLGVPLIAVRKTSVPSAYLAKTSADVSPAERFYPPGLTFPMTAFLHVTAHPHSPHHVYDEDRDEHIECNTVHHCVLSLCDPLEATDIAVKHIRGSVPLESDLSLPLAYFLNQPVFREAKLDNIAFLGLLNPLAGNKVRGLYMLEPYNPAKIPVVLVHGLASSPVTWTDMYNDLRAAPDIRERYQFWFYFYPTGQPFWVSATQLRMDLANTLAALDPERQSPSLDEMVLIGHSMGGLLSRLQTMESGDDFWHLVSDRSPEELQGDEAVKRKLLSMLYFRPSPSVARVVTMGTPHRGSEFSNRFTRTLTHAVTDIPSLMIDDEWRLVRQNPGYFNSTALMKMDTGVDSLAPDSPFFAPMLASGKARWVKYHNIVGVVDKQDFLRRIADEKGDGVVSLASASISGVESEVTVPAGHTSIHGHPKTIREVQRILREHLRELESGKLHLASFNERSGQMNGPRRGYRLEDHYLHSQSEAAAPVVSASHQDEIELQFPQQ